eukprot:2015995-Rhodomonas_salina.1
MHAETVRAALQCATLPRLFWPATSPEPRRHVAFAGNQLKPLNWPCPNREHLPDLQISRETELGSFSPNCPPDLALFKPDAFIVNHKTKLLVIFEFTRGMADWNESFETRMAKKRQAYHGVRQHLLRQFPDYEVCVSTFVLGVLGSILEQEWISQLANLGLDDKTCEKVTQAAIEHCIKGCGQVLAVWKAKLAEHGKL